MNEDTKEFVESDSVCGMFDTETGHLIANDPESAGTSYQFHEAIDIDLDYLFGEFLTDGSPLDLAFNGDENVTRDEVVKTIDGGGWLPCTYGNVKSAWVAANVRTR